MRNINIKIFIMKISKEEFNQKVESLYNGDIEVIGRFKSLMSPILVKDKYGLLKIPNARLLLINKPGFNYSVNKTSYFMEMLKEKHPSIYNSLNPLSEYEAMNKKMLFEDKFGEVSALPSNLISGHLPNIRSAINKKKYFESMLRYIYGNKYDYIIDYVSRKGGKTKLICPIHGEIIVDNDYLFIGKGCTRCNLTPSNLFYLIELSNEFEKFYKLGVSFRQNGVVRRYKDYKTMGYNINIIKEIDFNDHYKCKEFEYKLKKIIKPYIYNPKNWPNKSTTECFKIELLDIFLNSYINNDIV